MWGWVKMFLEEAAQAAWHLQYGIKAWGPCSVLRTDLQLNWMLHPDNALVGVDLVNMHCRVRAGYVAHVAAHSVPRMAEFLNWLRMPRAHIYIDERGVVHQVSAFDGFDQGCPA